MAGGGRRPGTPPSTPPPQTVGGCGGGHYHPPRHQQHRMQRGVAMNYSLEWIRWASTYWTCIGKQERNRIGPLLIWYFQFNWGGWWWGVLLQWAHCSRRGAYGHGLNPFQVLVGKASFKTIPLYTPITAPLGNMKPDRISIPYVGYLIAAEGRRKGGLFNSLRLWGFLFHIQMISAPTSSYMT